eukprot:g48335.t1
MGLLFGKPQKKDENKPSPVSENDKAVLELKRQRDRLKKFQAKLTAVRQREVEIAKELLAKGEKKRALLALRKKKHQEQLLQKAEQQQLNLEEMIASAEQQQLNLEEMIASVEFAAVQKQVLEALELGKNTLEALNSEWSLEDVEALMEESAEAIAKRNEISEALGTSLSQEDDAAVEEELQGLLDDGKVAVSVPQPVAERTAVASFSQDKQREMPQQEQAQAQAQPAMAAKSKAKAEPVVLAA